MMNGGANDDDLSGFAVPQQHAAEDLLDSTDTPHSFAANNAPDSVDLLGVYSQEVPGVTNGVHYSCSSLQHSADLLHLESQPFHGLDQMQENMIDLCPLESVEQSQVEPQVEQLAEYDAFHSSETAETMLTSHNTSELQPEILANECTNERMDVLQLESVAEPMPRDLPLYNQQQELEFYDEPLSEDDSNLHEEPLSDHEQPSEIEYSVESPLTKSAPLKVEEEVDVKSKKLETTNGTGDEISRDVTGLIAPEAPQTPSWVSPQADSDMEPSWVSTVISSGVERSKHDDHVSEIAPQVVELAPIECTEFVSAIEQDPSSSAESDALIVELYSRIQKYEVEMEETREQASRAEERAGKAEERVKELELLLQAKEFLEGELQESKLALNSALTDRENLLKELDKLREDRDEHEQKQIVLSNRLNAAKKREAEKANLAESLTDSMTVLKHELESTQTAVKEVTAIKERLEEDLKKSSTESEQQIKKLEALLGEERRLNEDRKKKMKAFVENKQEEVREAKSQNEELSMELAQTNRSLREHHSRWKQLHAQWVQSQTRNRELQRDINRMKMESENMSRMGDQMNVKLSQRAQETETHKNKRLTAKQELMTVLETLEAEREVRNKLQDSIKFTFTPKALSQQQILKENLRDFEHELVQLSQRLGKPLPPMHDTPAETFGMHDDHDEAESDGSPGVRRSKSQIDANHLLSNLEDETQRVSQCIMALSANIDRLHVLIAQSGERTCVAVFSDLLAAATSTRAVGASNDANGPRLGLGTNRQYGQVPTAND